MPEINRVPTDPVDCTGPCGRKGLNPQTDFYTTKNKHGLTTVTSKRARCKKCTIARVAARHKEVMAAKREKAHQ